MADSARSVIDSTRARLRASGNAEEYLMNEAHARLLIGERQTALGLLERAARRDPALRPRIAMFPWFDPLRGEPRFQRLVAGR
jgi:hypothetical protein